MVVQLRPLLVIVATELLVIITAVIITDVIITIIGAMVETRLSVQHSAQLLWVFFIGHYEQSILSDVSCRWFCSYRCVTLVTRCF